MQTVIRRRVAVPAAIAAGLLCSLLLVLHLSDSASLAEPSVNPHGGSSSDRVSGSGRVSDPDSVSGSDGSGSSEIYLDVQSSQP